MPQVLQALVLIRGKWVNSLDRAIRIEVKFRHLYVSQVVLVRELRICIEEPPSPVSLDDGVMCSPALHR